MNGFSIWGEIHSLAVARRGATAALGSLSLPRQRRDACFVLHPDMEGLIDGRPQCLVSEIHERHEGCCDHVLVDPQIRTFAVCRYVIGSAVSSRMER